MMERLLSLAARTLSGHYLDFADAGGIEPPPGPGQAGLLYLHVPFCRQLCPFCAFNRRPYEAGLARAYFEALRTEIRLYRDRGYRFEVVYCGGGTPTIAPDELQTTLALVRELWPIREISVETNPDHLVPDLMDRLLDCGVHRLSVGIQSFQDATLRRIDRFAVYGSGADLARALARAAGRFRTLNADMIFNFPCQTEADLDRDLDTLLATGVDQVTYYPLMVTRAGAAGIEARMGPVDYGRERRFYERIVERLRGVYRQSTIWCFSRRPGMVDEYITRHKQYAGLGSGAFGYLDGTVYFNTFDVPRYIAALRDGRIPLAGYRRYSQVEQARYDYLLSLLEGNLAPADLLRPYGPAAAACVLLEWAFFLLTGGIRYADGQLQLTAAGRYYWVVLLRTLFAEAGAFRLAELEKLGIRPPTGTAAAPCP